MSRHSARGRDWERVRRFVLKNATVCYRCGRPLDFDAPPRSRWSPSVDHILPASVLASYDPMTRQRMMLDPSNLRPMHYGCNSSRGNRRTNRYKASRQW